MKISNVLRYLTEPLWVLSQVAILIRRTVERLFLESNRTTYKSDLKQLNREMEQYAHGDSFNFQGLVVPKAAITPDMYFNVILPFLYLWKKPVNRRHLFRDQKRKFRSLGFYNDNILHFTYKKGMQAHGAPYFHSGCYVEKGDTVLDLGADPGDFSAFACLCGASKVFAFDPEHSSQLQKTSQLYPNIELVQYYIDKKSKTNNVITIDDYAERKNIRIDFIKMDIEGFELRALQGARQVILRDKPRLALCTYHRVLDRIKFYLFLKLLRPDYKIHTNNAILYAW